MDHPFTADEQRLIELWERHMSCEFAERDTAATVATMSGDNYVNHVPTMTGGRGREELLKFYGRHFIPKMPADTEIAPVCRTVGQGRVIDEIIFKFTHDTEMDWMLPGVPLPASGSKFPWWSSFNWAGTASSASASTGTRRRSSYNWGYSTHRVYPWREWRLLARSWTRAYRPTS